ncbi:hypothetical protein niasHT_008125 [Heterodera trifolii]|uniref:Uncharacterized protein n=1 Tax=Heterodera trifolii TaxID=157864 RepID=A0ABD2M008_9BILA
MNGWDKVKITLEGEEEKCEENEYEVLIEQINEKDDTFPIWQNAIEKRLAIGGEETTEEGTTQRIKFDNYFHLEISPNLPENSKMFYRMDIRCAGGDGQTAEFKSFTKANAIVVISSRQKCAAYDVRVWPTHLEWMEGGHKKLIDRPEYFEEGISIENGTLLRVCFSNHFDLRLSPRLEPNSEDIYVVEVKLHGDGAQKYRTKTEENARIVFGGTNGRRECRGTTAPAKYDIKVAFVWKKWGMLDRSSSISRRAMVAKDEEKVGGN